MVEHEPTVEVKSEDHDLEPWVVVRVEASVEVPKGTRIGVAYDGRGCRLILPDGRRVSPVLGLEVEVDAGKDEYQTLVNSSDLEKLGVAVIDYKYPPAGGDEVEEGEGCPVDEEL